MDALGSVQVRAIRDLPLLTEDEFQALIDQRDAGDPQAAHTIALHNMRLGYSHVVRTIAQMSYNKTGDIDADDLWQEVYLGLLNAAKEYDPSKGKFSTYAYQFINHRCCTVLHKWEKNVRGQAVSMDAQDEFERDDPVTEGIVDTIDEAADTNSLYTEFRKALGHLEPIEYQALALLYGIGCDPMKQKDAAEVLKISVTSLKGIIQCSFRKLRQLVVTGTNGRRPEYPLLLKYWADQDGDSVSQLMTPLLIENVVFEDDAEAGGL